MKKILLLAVLMLAASLASAQVYYSSGSMVTPDTATAYAAGEVMTTGGLTGTTTLIAMSGALPSKSYGGVIYAARLSSDSCNPTNAKVRAYLYADSTRFKKLGNRAPYTLDSVEIAIQRNPYIDFTFDSTGYGAGSTAMSALVSNIQLPVWAASSSTLFARLVALDAWEPGRRVKITLELWVKP